MLSDIFCLNLKRLRFISAISFSLKLHGTAYIHTTSDTIVSKLTYVGLS